MRSTPSRATSTVSTRWSPTAPISIASCAARCSPPRSSSTRSPPILDQAGIGGLAAKLLKVVASNRRLFAVRDIIKGFRTLVARHKGEVTAQVTFAETPSEAHLAAVKDALKAVTKQDVQVEVNVDPAIIGGLVVKLGSRMVDTSLRTKLNALKLAMKEAG